MNEEESIDRCYQVISDTATEIAQAYSDYGDLGGYYLGQTSTSLQLRLFRPLALETSLFLLSSLDQSSQHYADILSDTKKLAEELGVASLDERLRSYSEADERANHFLVSCQKVVSHDALYLSMRRKDTPVQETISDKGYVVIKRAAKEIQEVAASL